MSFVEGRGVEKGKNDEEGKEVEGRWVWGGSGLG